MELSRLLIKETNIHKLFPKCITKPDCNCLEDFQKLIPTFTNEDFYISQCIDFLEENLHVLKIHQNKESIVEVFYTVKISVRVIKSAIQFLANTKKIFHKWISKDRKCFIDFPNKPITINQYLHYVDLFCTYNNYVLEMMYCDDSKILMDYFRNMLDIHLELLFIFQQFRKLQSFGYTFVTETKLGSKNCIQLYWN